MPHTHAPIVQRVSSERVAKLDTTHRKKSTGRRTGHHIENLDNPNPPFSGAVQDLYSETRPTSWQIMWLPPGSVS